MFSPDFDMYSDTSSAATRFDGSNSNDGRYKHLGVISTFAPFAIFDIALATELNALRALANSASFISAMAMPSPTNSNVGISALSIQPSALALLSWERYEKREVLLAKGKDIRCDENLDDDDDDDDGPTSSMTAVAKQLTSQAKKPGFFASVFSRFKMAKEEIADKSGDNENPAVETVSNDNPDYDGSPVVAHSPARPAESIYAAANEVGAHYKTPSAVRSDKHYGMVANDLLPRSDVA